MATKQPTQLCYQVNGGYCMNKVSAKNYYVCAAGHRRTNNTNKDDAVAQLPIEAIRKMDSDTQCELAKNPLITHDIQQTLFDTEDKEIKWNLAKNPSIDREMIQALFDMEDWAIRRNLAKNPSIDREMAIELVKDKHAPVGYLKNKSTTELCSGENISLINDYPKEFGRAYLDHLLELDENLEEMKALFCYSYNSYVKAGGEDYFTLYKRKILEKYPGDEEIKYLLS